MFSQKQGQASVPIHTLRDYIRIVTIFRMCVLILIKCSLYDLGEHVCLNVVCMTQASIAHWAGIVFQYGFLHAFKND